MRPVIALTVVVFLVTACGKNKKARTHNVSAKPPAAEQAEKPAAYVPKLAAVSPQPHYVAGLTGIMEGFRSKPVTHRMFPQDEPFEWARQELRKGRPILAALPREIWQALPPGFIAAHPWNGGSVGHQIVINGFTWDASTKKGTFHLINSWAELMEFDLSTEAVQNGLLIMEKSLSPIGEAKTETVKETVRKVTFIKSLGSSNLYEVETNLCTRRVAAPSEERIYSLVEQGK